MVTGRARKTKASRRADAFFAFAIPIFFMCLAAYQALKFHSVDKYVIGALLVGWLGAIGWKLDSFFETYLEIKAGRRVDERNGA